MCIRIARGESVEPVRGYPLGLLFVSPVEDVQLFGLQLSIASAHVWRTRIAGRPSVDESIASAPLCAQWRSFSGTYRGQRRRVWDPYFRYFFQDPVDVAALVASVFVVGGRGSATGRPLMRAGMTRREALSGLGVVGAAGLLGGVSCTRETASKSASGCESLNATRIRWIVPHSPGGGYDAESRMLEPFLERRLGVEIAVENMAGAGGLIGARALAAAPRDGSTLGILGMPGLLVASAIGEAEARSMPAAFTILGRISRSWHVWATGRTRGFTRWTMRLRPHGRSLCVAGVSEVGSVNFTSLTVSASILDVPITIVAGFDGSRSAALAAVRGDVDLVCFDFEAIRNPLESGELRAILQVSGRVTDPHPSLAGVPKLGGLGGVASGTMTDALIELIASGRVVAAPPAMEPALAACLSNAVHETLRSPELGAVARRPLDVATGGDALRDVRAASSDLAALLDPVRRALKTVRG